MKSTSAKTPQTNSGAITVSNNYRLGGGNQEANLRQKKRWDDYQRQANFPSHSMSPCVLQPPGLAGTH